MTISGTVASTTFNWTRDNTVAVTGIAGSGSGNISGSLTNTTNAAVTVTFTITPVANGCSGVPVTATVVVKPKPDAIATSASQNACSGSPISNIVLTSGVAGTTFTWTRNNSGVTGIANSGSGNISGTLTNSTTAPIIVTFTIMPTATACPGNTITATVTVNPKPTVAATNSPQTICSGNSIVAMALSGNVTGTVYNWTRDNTASVTGIAASGSGNISGTLTNTTSANVTVTFTITPLANGCTGTPITTIVIVKPKPTVAATNASQTICSGDTIATMVLSSSTVGTTYTWTRNNTVNVTGIAASGSGDISGTLNNITTAPITVTFTISPTANGCPGTPITATVVVISSTDGGVITPALITTCAPASGTLTLSSYLGTVLRWESSTTGGTTWTTIPGPITTTTHNYSGINQTTIFRAVVENTSFCPIAYSVTAVVNAIPTIIPTPVVATPSTICAGDSSILTSQSGYATSQNLATGGAFNNSNPTGWLVDGCGNCLNAGGSNTNPGPFQLSATNGGTYSGINYSATGKFAIANGNFNSIMQTPTFSTVGLTTATLEFNHAYNLVGTSWVRVELSLDGGASYNIVLAEYFATDTRTPYNNFPLESINLSAYIGQTSLKVRFNYHGSAGSSWAIDNIRIPDVPVGLNTQWVDTTNGQIISNTSTATVSPIVTTTYTVSTTIGSCTGGSQNVTVTVNPRPTASIGPNQTVCNGGTATFSIALTGTAPWTITYTNGTTPTTVTTSLNPYVFSVPNITSNVSCWITALRDFRCIAIPGDFTGMANITVLNGTPGLWTGLVSTDWFDCHNWSGGLPSSTVNAMINAGSPRMPLIDRSSPFAAAYGFIASAQDLILNAGTSLTMAATNNSELMVSRDWKNNGTFIPGTGTVTFNGATSNLIQTVNEGIKTQETFYNMTVSTSNGGKGVSVVTGFELTVIQNLSLLNGDLRLTGDAQLVQNGTAANPAGGTGKLVADQQGTKSSWRYNYWCAPVSTDNINYTVGGILRDGTDVVSFPFNPYSIAFGNGVTFADGVASIPIKISNSWIFKYTALSNSYSAWQPIGSTGSLKIAEGFTMKGTDGTAAFLTQQNYVFYGKPNSGTITLNISLAQSYLIGNPYPSALNADAFIIDNIKDGGNASSNNFNGALYFWDHFGGQTHLLNEYIGGYATYSLMGGAVAVANDPLTVNNNSTGTRMPGKFIPVGQGFFIGTIVDPLLTTNNPGLTSAITGGPIVFKNTQRLFKTESSSSVFFRNQNESTTAIDVDNRPKIRLKFISPSGVQRQLLLGADSRTSTLFDLGYDAPMIDVNNEDLYWDLNHSKFVIQAITDFSSNQEISLGVKVASVGLTTIKIDNLENITDATSIFIYDNFTGLYYDLKNGDFTASLPIGEHNDRFSVRFSEVALDVDQHNGAGIEIIHVQNGNQLLINNSLIGETVKKVTLVNLIGQAIQNWEVENLDQENIQIPIKNISIGAYVVRIHTSSGTLSKKIIIKQ
ncbi:PKD-like domain-containing protein [Flavobacterium sp. GT3R68]|uniref:PKD-like domain-containing protein n=1 Tax=Flavobacterium sp. GT3R68 TaxID=2594437 RepID=UPI00210238F4|nr:PKD-like domain-containing protein [Flavobacterium sp. GT3R68]